MRIIANKSDYYDGCQDYTKSRFNKVWVREYREIWINKDKLAELERRHLRIGRSGWETGYLILNGEVVPYVKYNYDGYYKRTGEWAESGTFYFYNADEAQRVFDNQKRPQYRDKWQYRYWGWERNIKQDLVDFFLPYARRDDLCIERKTPILRIEPMRNGYEERYSPVRRCHADVNLQKMQVTKLFGSYQMYQELDMYYNNTLANDDMVMKPITDKLKVKIHGFDEKYGFRTRKGVK